MKLQLSNSISSELELSALIREVRDYAQWYQHTSIKQKVGAKSPIAQPTLSPVAADLLRTWSDGAQITESIINSLIDELENFRQTAPTITITLAAPATRDVRQLLVGWCRANLAPNILVTFNFNSTICGGMVVRIGSRVHDWSFRRKILAAKDKFPGALRHV